LTSLGPQATYKRKMTAICGAKVAELVDAQDSGSCGVTPVGVRLPSFAPDLPFI
jgi:hypothetical protein